VQDSKLRRSSPTGGAQRFITIRATAATTLASHAAIETCQTLQRSFVVGGIGLHTGEYAVVRIMPAFAGDGRYFVRVSEGANHSSWLIDRPDGEHMPGGRGAPLSLCFSEVQ
jgi:hypothetical protein